MVVDVHLFPVRLTTYQKCVLAIDQEGDENQWLEHFRLRRNGIGGRESVARGLSPPVKWHCHYLRGIVLLMA